MDGHISLTEDTIRTGGAAEADAALMDGHTPFRVLAMTWRAAEADAALMDGHCSPTTPLRSSPAAAEADAALMDGHVRTALELVGQLPPRRPTRP